MNNERGYLALIAVIVISVLLLAITLSLSFSGFLVRFNILIAESKERSRGLAEACMDLALVKRASDPSYTGPETLNVGSETCNVISITTSGSNLIIDTQGVINTAYTNIRAVVSDADLQIISWAEVANF